MVVRWQLRDVWETGPTPYVYTLDVNPDEGGSPKVTKQMAVQSNTGPGRAPILQEGQTDPPTLSFSGAILTQGHYEALEYWHDRRVMLELTDDLNRVFRGVLTSFSPERTRRAFNVWFHRYSAEFSVFSYVNASGIPVYGSPGYVPPPVVLGPNLLTNPSFEDPFVATFNETMPTAWQQGSEAEPVEEVVVYTKVDAPHGRQVVQLHCDDGGRNSFLEQLAPVVGGRWTRAEASYYLDGPPEPAFWDRGLMLSITTDDGSAHGAAGSIVQANAPITAESEPFRWERLDLRLYVPPQVEDGVCQVRLYCPGTAADAEPGDRTLILWDDVILQQE